MSPQPDSQPTVLGHPTGLFVLFFAEMWERFSYYGMRALLVFYMIKGFLGYNDEEAYKVYGAYTALVYMTPFFGGMLADRLLGGRRAVVLGGLLMAAGHLLMTVESAVPFFTALALLIVGNGFFKPNISTMVGSLYGEHDTRRDGGFTLFYMGINLGAAMAPLLCGYVGETFGWHYGFGLATIGMLVGLAVFVVPTRIAQLLILGGALATAVGMVALQENWLLLVVNGFVGVALAVAGVIAFVALGRAGLPPEAGGPPDPELLKKPVAGIPLEWVVYLGALATVPALALLVYSNRVVTLISEESLEIFTKSPTPSVRLLGTFLTEMSTLAGVLLLVTGLVGFGYLLFESLRSEKVVRERLWVALTLMSFSMLFWAFFEQAGSSMNNFTDRNVDRVFEERQLGAADIGRSLGFRVGFATDNDALRDAPVLGQEQLGYPLGEAPFTMSRLLYIEAAHDKLRKARKRSAGATSPELLAALAELEAMAAAAPTVTAGFKESTEALGEVEERLEELAKADPEAGRGDPGVTDTLVVEWPVAQAHVGMGVGGTVVPASTYQSANPIFILTFGLVFSALWTALARRNLEPAAPAKFALGLLQLGLGFAALWYGAQQADGRGMVGMEWLLLGYLLHTTGELCLSPVGLSMMTRLSPKHLASTAMGAWFLATAYSNLLMAVIATFTGVGGEGDEEQVIPIPLETVDVYGDVFGTIALACLAATVVAFGLSPILRRWMHEEAGLPEGSGH